MERVVDFQEILAKGVEAGVQFQKIVVQLDKIVGKFEERLIELDHLRCVAKLSKIQADLQKVIAHRM
jgi:hypothetical protein